MFLRARLKIMSSEIKIENATAVGKQWDEYVLQHPQSSFFHLSGWGRVLEKTFPYGSFSCAAVRAGRVCGVLPLFSVKNLPFGHSLVSAPLAVYGGICADDRDATNALLDYSRQLADRMGVRFLEFRSQQPLPELPVKDLYVTFKKEIHPDPGKNMAAIRAKQRRMIRQGEKHDLTTQIGGEELLASFYKVYAHSVRNLGTPVYPLRLFKNLLQEFGPACKILGVFHGKEMLSGVMTFFYREEVLPYYGGALKEAFRFAVNDFMYWKLMCYGAENGYKVFDYGRSKVGSGSYDFKRHWNFEPMPLPYQYYLVKQKALPNLSPMNPKFSLPIEVWKRLPLWLSCWVGPKIIRFFP